MICSYCNILELDLLKLIYQLCILVGILYQLLRLKLFVVTLPRVKLTNQKFCRISRLHILHCQLRSMLLPIKIVNYSTCLRLQLSLFETLKLHLHKHYVAKFEQQILIIVIYLCQGLLTTVYDLST